jgi:hypothetical protein
MAGTKMKPDESDCTATDQLACACEARSARRDPLGRCENLLERHAAKPAVHANFEDDVVQVLKMPHATTFGMGKQQPLALDHLVGASLAPDLVTTVATQNQGRTLAWSGVMGDFDFHAAIFTLRVRVGRRIEGDA